MKKTLTLFAAIVLLAVGATAQKLNYSAVVRNNTTNELVVNENLTVVVSIANSVDGDAVYTELHQVTTNQNGLVSLVIGDGTNQTGSLSDVTWPTAFITTDYTLPGGAHVMNTVPVNAVPYALYAETAGSAPTVTPQDIINAVYQMTPEQITEIVEVLNGGEPNPPTPVIVCASVPSHTFDVSLTDGYFTATIPFTPGTGAISVTGSFSASYMGTEQQSGVLSADQLHPNGQNIVLNFPLSALEVLDFGWTITFNVILFDHSSSYCPTIALSGTYEQGQLFVCPSFGETSVNPATPPYDDNPDGPVMNPLLSYFVIETPIINYDASLIDPTSAKFEISYVLDGQTQVIVRTVNNTYGNDITFENGVMRCTFGEYQLVSSVSATPSISYTGSCSSYPPITGEPGTYGNFPTQDCPTLGDITYTISGDNVVFSAPVTNSQSHPLTNPTGNITYLTAGGGQNLPGGVISLPLDVTYSSTTQKLTAMVPLNDILHNMVTVSFGATVEGCDDLSASKNLAITGVCPTFGSTTVSYANDGTLTMTTVVNNNSSATITGASYNIVGSSGNSTIMTADISGNSIMTYLTPASMQMIGIYGQTLLVTPYLEVSGCDQTSVEGNTISVPGSASCPTIGDITYSISGDSVVIFTAVVTNPHNLTLSTPAGGLSYNTGGSNPNLPGGIVNIPFNNVSYNPMTKKLSATFPFSTIENKVVAVNFSAYVGGCDYISGSNSLTVINYKAPTVTTGIPTNVTSYSAKSYGHIDSDGGLPVTACGLCWGTSANPGLSGSHTVSTPDSMGYFNASLDSLHPATTYHVRAYATNSKGTAWGVDRTFTTEALITVPVVTTDPVMLITSTTAAGGGEVTNSGASTVTKHGVCWSTSHNPTLNDPHTEANGGGSFGSNMTNLTPLTTYYVRAYATNSFGTGYGNEVSFMTKGSGSPANFTCGTSWVKDNEYDDNSYTTVQIGNQCWMAENLRCTRYSNGVTVIQNIHAPGNNPVDSYGYLYDWAAVMNNANPSNTNPSGVKGICPVGWHVPSDLEWTQLVNYLQDHSEDYACGYTASWVAKALSSKTGWKQSDYSCSVGNNPDDNNTTGFNAKPAGKYGSSNSSDGTVTHFWTTREYDDTYAWSRYLENDKTYVRDGGYPKSEFFSVRCVKNN